MDPTIQNNLVTLLSILEGNNNASKNICESLTKRGYAFIILPDYLVKEIDDLLIVINEFFNKTQQYKNQFFKKPIFGYFGVGHKESFRIFTGTRMKEHMFPLTFDKLQDFVRYIDKIMYSIALLLSPYIFPNLMNKSKELDIPLFNVNKTWGMFDVTKYYNDGTRKELNCLEHYDPGLLSLSLRSTESGLQLKDEHGKWINAPTNKNIAILWTGKAAIQINPKLKPGIHRVINPTIGTLANPRIAIWYEICTSYQEHKELLDDKTKKASTFENISGIPMSKTLHPSELEKIQNNSSKNKYNTHNDLLTKYTQITQQSMIKPFDGYAKFAPIDDHKTSYRSASQYVMDTFY